MKLIGNGKIFGKIVHIINTQIDKNLDASDSHSLCMSNRKKETKQSKTGRESK